MDASPPTSAAHAGLIASIRRSLSRTMVSVFLQSRDSCQSRYTPAAARRHVSVITGRAVGLTATSKNAGTTAVVSASRCAYSRSYLPPGPVLGPGDAGSRHFTALRPPGDGHARARQLLSPGTRRSSKARAVHRRRQRPRSGSGRLGAAGTCTQHDLMSGNRAGERHLSVAAGALGTRQGWAHPSAEIGMIRLCGYHDPRASPSWFSW